MSRGFQTILKVNRNLVTQIDKKIYIYYITFSFSLIYSVTNDNFRNYEINKYHSQTAMNILQN